MTHYFKTNLCCPIFLLCVIYHLILVYIPGPTLVENLTFKLPASINFNISSDRVRFCILFPLPCWNLVFHTSQVVKSCTSCMSYMDSIVSVLKVFLIVIHLISLLNIFHTLYAINPESQDLRMKFIWFLQGWIFCRHLFSSRHPLLFICDNQHLL